MKSRALMIAIAAAAAVALPAGGKDAATTQPAPDSEVRAKGSYCLGLLLGRDLKKQKLPIDLDRFVKGVRDGLAGAKTQLTDKEIEQAVVALEKQHRERLAAKNLKTAQAFLARTKKIEGVKVTASGLQYMVIRGGTGERPKLTDTVVVHYRGSHLDNTVFDSSIARGKAEVIPVSACLPAWREALQLMREGAKWKLFAPAKLAYGKTGYEDVIEPNEALIFELELIQIRNPPPGP